MIETILNRINDPSYGTPMLSGNKLQRYITPEIGWLLTRMDNRVELLKRASPENHTIQEIQRTQRNTITLITKDGSNARTLNYRKKRKYYDGLASHAVTLETLGCASEGRNVVNMAAKPRKKGREQMREDRKTNKTLAAIRKANGTNIALLWQAESALNISRNDFEMLASSIRRNYAEGTPISPEAIRTANTLENQTIKTQEGVVEHLKELVKTGKEAEDKLMSKLLNERLAKATKSLIGNVKQVKSITDLANSGSALSVETLKAYNHEVSPDSQLQELDNEVYLAKLLGDNPHSRNQEKED